MIKRFLVLFLFPFVCFAEANLLVAAKDFTSGFKKGDIINVYDAGYNWGNKEGLPNFIRLTISNVERAEVLQYLDSWKKLYNYSIDQNLPATYIASMTVDPALIAASGANNVIEGEIADYLANHPDYTILVLSTSQTAIQVSILKPADLERLRLEVDDIFSRNVQFRRYYFQASAIDQAISAGGAVTRTAAQVMPFLVDRLTE